MQSTSEVQQPQASGEERGRSTVEFPYFDLDSAVEIAQAVRDLGVTSCDPASLATKLNMAPDGGGFRMRLITSKVFGLINYGRSAGGQVELTDLGQTVTDPSTERRGRLDAFMSISLYRTLFERLKGQVLPPPPAIERLMETMGVAPKQKDKARQVFLRSAKQAGLFELSNDRMTPPANLGAVNAAPPPAATGAAEHQSARKRGGDDDRHPFIRGLIDKLPPPDSNWDLASRAKWLTTAANIFDLMYVDNDPSGVQVVLKGRTLSIDVGGEK